ncbi:MAG: XdhC family protein [Candidatus Eisenbacteria bacterium]
MPRGRTGIEAYRGARIALEAGNTVALATVIRAEGSTPREAGAHMAVLPDGTLLESVGGGPGEHGVLQAARDSMESGHAAIVRLDLGGRTDPRAPAVCGGKMEILVEPLRPARDIEWVRTVVRLCEEGRPVLILRELNEDRAVECLVLAVAEKDGAIAWRRGDAPLPDHRAAERGPLVRFLQRQGARSPLLVEEIPPVERLIIVGGGHIGRALSSIGSLLRFEVTVVDEREEFADRRRFPEAACVLHGDPGAILETVPGGMSAYFVLVSHGYPTDVKALSALVRKETRYIGMIGSRKRVDMVRRALSEKGIEPGALGRLFAPIGIGIGAQTPEEIAISIAAEIVAVRNGLGGGAGSLSERRETG